MFIIYSNWSIVWCITFILVERERLLGRAYYLYWFLDEILFIERYLFWTFAIKISRDKSYSTGSRGETLDFLLAHSINPDVSFFSKPIENTDSEEEMKLFVTKKLSWNISSIHWACGRQHFKFYWERWWCRNWKTL